MAGKRRGTRWIFFPLTKIEPTESTPVPISGSPRSKVARSAASANARLGSSALAEGNFEKKHIETEASKRHRLSSQLPSSASLSFSLYPPRKRRPRKGYTSRYSRVLISFSFSRGNFLRSEKKREGKRGRIA